jgi:hypothetical protein
MIIFSIFSKHEDFIELQYNSIEKHVKGQYEYVILNNGPNAVQSKLNRDKCKELGIRCIDIDSNSYGNPSMIAGGALNKMFELFKGQTIFKIDSDMFFMSDIELEYILERNDILYIPQFSDVFSSEWIWSGVFGLNGNITSSPIDCLPEPGIDTFGKSRFLLQTPHQTKKLRLFSLHDFNGGNVVGSINNDCMIKFNTNGEIVSVEREDYISKYDLSKIDLYEKYTSIITMLKEHSFPEPYMIDVITLDEVDVIFHFKSASWQYNSSQQDHVNIKKVSTKKLLEYNIEN